MSSIITPEIIQKCPWLQHLEPSVSTGWKEIFTDQKKKEMLDYAVLMGFDFSPSEKVAS